MKSLLYAPRVKGDLDLGLEPSRIDSVGKRRWARIEAPGGRLPGRPEQGFLEASTTQNYRVGTRRVDGDRVFHYCYAQEFCRGFRGAFTDPQRFYPTVHLAAKCDGASPGEFMVTYESAREVYEDELAEGYLVCWSPYICQRIKSNTESVGAAPNCRLTVTLEEPLAYAIAVDQAVTGYPNIYRHCVDLGGPKWGQVWGTVCCIPYGLTHGVGIWVQAGEWFWGLTWGPTPLVVNWWGTMVGRGINMRLVYFGNDGGIVYNGTAGVQAAYQQYQHAGHIMFDGNTDVTPWGDQMVFIELAP